MQNYSSFTSVDATEEACLLLHVDIEYSWQLLPP